MPEFAYGVMRGQLQGGMLDKTHRIVVDVAPKIGSTVMASTIVFPWLDQG